MIINLTKYTEGGWYKPIKLNFTDEEKLNSFSELTDINTLSSNQLVFSTGNFVKHDTVELSENGLLMSRNNNNFIETIATEYTKKTTYSAQGDRIDLKIPVSDKSRRTYTDKGFDTRIESLDMTSSILKEADEYKKYLTYETYNYKNRQDAVYADEAYLTNELATKYTGNAKNLLEFFSGEKPADVETKELAADIAEVIKYLGVNMAEGKEFLTNEWPKLQLGNVEMSLEELTLAIATMNDIGNHYHRTAFLLNEPADFAIAGLASAKMKAITSSMSDEASEMVMNTYNSKISYYIDNHDQRMLDIPSILKSINHKNSNEVIPEDGISVDYYYHTTSLFEDSGKKDIYDYFSNIDTTNELRLKDGFEGALEKYNHFLSERSNQRGYEVNNDEPNIDKIQEAFRIMMIQ